MRRYPKSRVRNPELGGVVGNPINKHDQPYGLTEEFVEVYRLHSLLPETLRTEIDQLQPKTQLPSHNLRSANSAQVTGWISKKLPNSSASLICYFSFGNQNPGELVLNNLSTLYARIEHSQVTRCLTG